MASVKICDGRTVVYQYDTGVSIELCDCRDFTECHFAVNDGIIRRDVEDNICSVPDAALVNAGTLTVYAFSRNDDGGQTQHTFFIHVMARPKPADYIDPPDEADYIDLIAERAAKALPLFIVHVERVDGVLRADKTPAEISEALNARRVCMLRYGDAVLSFYGWRDGNPAFAGVPFKAFSTAHGAHYVHDFVVLDDGTVDATISEVNGLTAYPLVFEGGVEASYNGSKETRINISNVVNNALTVAKESGDFNGEPGTSVTINSITQSTEDDGYSVVTFSDGKQLRVKNGSKGSAGEGGAGGGVLTVTCTPTEDMQSFTADKTVAEISEAFAQGKAVQAYVLGVDVIAHAFGISPDVATFSAVASVAGESLVFAVIMMADGTNALQMSALGGVTVVNIITEDGETYTADRSPEDLFAAVTMGTPVYASFMGAYVPAQYIGEESSVFRAAVPGGTVTAIIDGSGVTVDVAPEGGGVTIVHVTEVMNGAYETDMMAEDIYARYSAGERVVCHLVPNAGIRMFLSPIVVTDTGTIFSGIFDAQGQYTMSVSVTVTNDTKAIIAKKPLDKLPNPEPLTINGTSYDGSEAVNIDIAAGGGGNKWELIETITISSDVTSINRTKDLNGATYSLAAAMIRADCGATATGGYVRVYFRGTSSYIEIHIDAAVGGTSLSWTAECCQECGMMIGKATTPRNGSRDAASYIPPRYGYDFIPAEPIKKIELVTNSKFAVGTKIEIWGVRA